MSSIQLALTNFNLLQISYQAADQENKVQRTVEPFALYSTQENWILIAFCRLRQDYRAFRLDRISQLEILEEHFEPHKMTLREYFAYCLEKSKPLT
ncbi:hypothetical protein D3C71_1490160 [compost metagenome]